MPLSGEAGLLALIDRHFPTAHAGFSIGRGDDCAVFQSGAPIALSSDLFLEDAHFRRAYFSGGETGRKALAVNLSDLAACGAEPYAFSLCLGLPADLDAAWIEDFFRGMASLAGEHKLFLCGGDLSRAEKIQVGITILGKQPVDGELLARGRAKPGDVIFLMGDIGLARTGLAHLEREGRACETLWPDAVGVHISPKPLVNTGLALGKLARASEGGIALMDVSDGFARDLPRLLGPEKGASLALAEAALPQEVLRHCQIERIDAVEFAISGGEDYALLGSCPANLSDSLRGIDPNVKILGQVTGKGPIMCNGKPLAGGFDHFE